jgi:hypothetical protein
MISNEQDDTAVRAAKAALNSPLNELRTQHRSRRKWAGARTASIDVRAGVSRPAGGIASMLQSRAC